MTIADMWAKIKNSPSEILWRVMSWFITTFIVFPNIVVFMYAVYMRENGFFSYDFFTDGSSALKVYLIIPTAMLIISSIGFGVMMDGFFSPHRVPLNLKRTAPNSTQQSKWVTRCIQHPIFDIFRPSQWVTTRALIFLTFCLFIALLGLISIFLNTQHFIFTLAFISLMCGIHLAILLNFNAKKSFISLFLVSLSSLIMIWRASTPVAMSIGYGIAQFGMGGNIPVGIQLNNDVKIAGRLKLISPNYIYILPQDREYVTTIPMSQVNHYEILSDHKQYRPYDFDFKKQDREEKPQSTVNKEVINMEPSVCRVVGCQIE